MDRFGVIASVLCAIHCLLAPLVFLVLPAIGGVWAHPATHWIIAALVVPVALLTMRNGFRRHRKSWVMVAGLSGVLLVVAGAAAPAFAAGDGPALSETVSACEACCPSLASDESGEMILTLPLASILSVLGGLALIACHVGNLCLCRGCRAA